MARRVSPMFSGATCPTASSVLSILPAWLPVLAEHLGELRGGAGARGTDGAVGLGPDRGDAVPRLFHPEEAQLLPDGGLLSGSLALELLLDALHGRQLVQPLALATLGFAR